MMNNMFSMFDPSSSYLSMSWMILAAPLILMKNKKTPTNCKTSKIFSSFQKNFSTEMKQLLEKKSKMTSNLVVKMFMMVMTLNMMAIFPFNFTPTAHVSMSFSISLSMWMSIILFGWINQFSHMMTHLTPLGTPSNLMNFMVLIETVSTIIRPITLSIRLSANMVAGHLLMSLLSTFSISSQKMMSIVPMMVLTSLEIMVAMVQAYVLTTLLMLYQNETSS